MWKWREWCGMLSECEIVGVGRNRCYIVIHFVGPWVRLPYILMYL